MAATGRGAVLSDAGAPFEVIELEWDEPGPGQLLVKMVASGVCHSDLGVQAGAVPTELPAIIGHEGAGVVVAVGDGVTAAEPGDKVLLSFAHCGQCPECQAGHPAYCAAFFPLNILLAPRGPQSGEARDQDGNVVRTHFFGQSSFAEYGIVDEVCVVKVDDDADLETLAPIGCGVITGVGAVWNSLDPHEEDTVAVYGVGGVGISGLWAAAQRKPRMVIAIDRVAERLELAKQFGATHTIDASTEDVAARLAELTDGRGVTKTFDTTASPAVAAGALKATAQHGTVLICGITAPGTTMPIDMIDILQDKTIKGVSMGDSQPRELVAQLAKEVKTGSFPLGLLQRRYAIDELNEAAHDMHSGATVKPVIVF